MAPIVKEIWDETFGTVKWREGGIREGGGRGMTTPIDVDVVAEKEFAPFKATTTMTMRALALPLLLFLRLPSSLFISSQNGYCSTAGYNNNHNHNHHHVHVCWNTDTHRLPPFHRLLSLSLRAVLYAAMGQYRFNCAIFSDSYWRRAASKNKKTARFERREKKEKRREVGRNLFLSTVPLRRLPSYEIQTHTATHRVVSNLRIGTERDWNERPSQPWKK